MQCVRVPGTRRVRGRTALLAFVSLVGSLQLPQAALADKVKVKTEISAAADLNPDRNGRASPVVLLMFQLSAVDAFQNADFFSLFDPDAAIIAADMLERTEMTLQPGEVRPLEAEFDEEARYIGLVAAFRDVEKAQWRGIVELPDKGFLKKVFSRDKLLIQLQALAVTATIE
jgi:type VI secretion system protein VasD